MNIPIKKWQNLELKSRFTINPASGARLIQIQSSIDHDCTIQREYSLQN